MAKKTTTKSSVNTESILQELNKFITTTDLSINTKNVGTVKQISDGVLEINGLSAGRMGEMIEIGERKSKGVILNLNKTSLGAVVMGEYTHIKTGDEVRSTGQLLSIPVADELLGRVVNPLGNPIDGKGRITSKTRYPLEKIAAGIVERQSVNQPLVTGIKAIDAITPIGRGQRQLVIGDRGTGKSSIGITSIINQNNQDVICIYVAIGQKASFIAQTINILEEHDAMDHTIIVAASASESAVLQYLAPYAGTAVGEYFMNQGKDVLIIYDDLSKQAWAYREVSLLLRRPAGREAYPGDVFYLHSRLLERSCRLSEKKGGGSITSLPIIETQEGDVSAYIPTNVISITDGQIYLEPDLFNSDIRPAINVGLSVSRVGGAAQTKAMKQVAGKLRLDLAQFRELAAFSQFASDLDEKTQAQLRLGERLTEILKQGWDDPYKLGEQIIVIWAATNGYTDSVPKDNIKPWEEALVSELRLKHKKIVDEISQSKDKLSDKQTKELDKILTKFNQTTGSKFINRTDE